MHYSEKLSPAQKCQLWIKVVGLLTREHKDIFNIQFHKLYRRTKMYYEGVEDPLTGRYVSTSKDQLHIEIILDKQD